MEKEDIKKIHSLVCKYAISSQKNKMRMKSEGLINKEKISLVMREMASKRDPKKVREAARQTGLKNRKHIHVFVRTDTGKRYYCDICKKYLSQFDARSLQLMKNNGLLNFLAE